MPEQDLAVADGPPPGEAAPKKKSRAAKVVALLTFLMALGGGFYAASAGLVALPGAIASALPGGGKADDSHAAPGGHDATSSADGHLAPVYVPVEQMVVPLGPAASAEFLVIETEIEVEAADAEAFERLRPRIRDAFNTFLRAVDERDIEDPSATLRLRAKLLRRVRAVSGGVAPRDLLITTFILK